MTLHERTGERDLLYSRWHRPDRIRRFLPARDAAALTVIDIDWCEACPLCFEPLALIETQRSVGRPKSARITVNLARRAQIPAFSVSYIASDDGEDIVRFLVQQLWAHSHDGAGPAAGRVRRRWLVDLRGRHTCGDERAEVLHGVEAS